jgi:hypothetical protein
MTKYVVFFQSGCARMHASIDECFQEKQTVAFSLTRARPKARLQVTRPTKDYSSIVSQPGEW